MDAPLPYVAQVTGLRHLSDAERERSLAHMLAGWSGDDPVWVFGYGSLIWKPEFVFDAKTCAVVHGYHRSLCLWSRLYRGTPDKPGLVLGLEPGGSCQGVAFRIPARDVREHLRALWRRELVTGSYRPRWLRIRTAGASGDTLEAIAFVINRTASGYAGALDRQTLLQVLRTAHGRNGTCADYLLATVRSLAEHGIQDRRLNALAHEAGLHSSRSHHLA